MSLKEYASKEYVNEKVNDKIVTPPIAEVGQVICVSEVDDNGQPISWGVVDLPKEDEYVTILNKTFENVTNNTNEWGNESHLYDNRHFWTTDVDGNPLDIDYVRLSIHVPSQSEVTSGEVKPGVGYGPITNWGSWTGHSQQQAYIGYPSFVSTDKERWAIWEWDLRTQSHWASYITGQKINGNYQGATRVEALAFSQAVTLNNWTAWSGIEVQLVSGSFPAGTQILITARKRNPNKVGLMPNWEIE